MRSLRTCGNCQCDIVSAYTGIRAHAYFPFVTTWYPRPCLFCVHRDLLNTFVLRREVKIRQQGVWETIRNVCGIHGIWRFAMALSAISSALSGQIAAERRPPPTAADSLRPPPTV